MKISRDAVIYIVERMVIAPNGCWEWTKSKDKDGYGYAKYSKKIKAHRLSFKIFNSLKDKDIAGKLVCHTCDNPSCVNPKHLFLGSHNDNNQDMIAKNRSNFSFTRLRKLSEDEVREIRREFKEAKKRGEIVTYVSYGKKYGVSNVTIKNLVSGKTYSHVKEER